MHFVVRIAVARALRESAANPRFHLREDVRLKSALEVERVGELLLRSPASGLYGAPRQRIQSACCGGHCVQCMSAEGVDDDVFGIGFANRRRTIVGLQDVPPVIVFQIEDSRVRRMPALAPFVRVSSIAEADLVPAPSVGLKHATGWSRGDESEIVRRPGKRVMHSVEAAAHIGPSEIAQQALADAVAL